MFAVDERGDHVHRTWSEKGNDRDDLFKKIDVQLFGKIRHASCFDLEDAESFSLVDEIKGF